MSETPDELKTALLSSMQFGHGDGDEASTALAVLPRHDDSGVVMSTFETENGGVPVMLVGGRVPGRIINPSYAVPLDQLAIDEGHTLRVAYDPEADKADLLKLANSIAESGGIQEPLLVVFRDEWIGEGETRRPLFRIRLGQRRYYAALILAAASSPVVATIPIQLPQNAGEEGQLFMLAFARQKQQKNLSLLDQVDGVIRLIDEYRYTQVQVGNYLGYDQSKISSMYAAKGEPLVIRNYMASDAVTLEHVNRMRKGCKNLSDRELLALYVVLEGLSADMTSKLCTGLWPLPGMGKPKYALRHIAETNKVALDVLPGGSTATLKLTADTKGSGEHYWQRGRPIAAQTTVVRRLAREHVVHLTGNAANPQVVLADLELETMTARLASYGSSAPLADVETELLALLESIHMAARAPRSATVSADERPLVTAAR